MNAAATVLSFLVLLVGSLIFGFRRQPKEMVICVLAGALGLSFSNIDKISRFKAAGFEAEMHEKVEAVIEKETEPKLQPYVAGDKVEAFALVGDESPKVIASLMESRYTWRRVEGISNDTGVPQQKVRDTLSWLLENGLAGASLVANEQVWSLTGKGRRVFQALNAKQES